jgi:hypothetical protein
MSAREPWRKHAINSTRVYPENDSIIIISSKILGSL